MPGSAYLITGDQKVREGNHVKVLLRTAGLARGQHRLLDMLTRGAGKGELRRCLIHLLGEVKVLHGHLAGATTTAMSEGAGLSCSKAKALDLNFVFVLRVVTLAFHPVDLQEIVNYCHFELVLLPISMGTALAQGKYSRT